MFKFFKILKAQLKQSNNQIKQINSFEKEISKLTEIQIKERINNLIQRYQINKNLDEILVESFALTREASKRTLGLRHFDTQLLGGIILHQGKIAEMKTGEGKTLVATLPVVLNALSLKGVHVVTANEYLAKRDKQIMSQIYRYLGLSVGLIQESMNPDERRKNYAADITYVTNTEVAFDYLRDNMANSLDDLVQRDFNYCIIDEVDSILIDEARTPLIISGRIDMKMDKYLISDQICNYFIPKVHYLVNEKFKNITLTNKGVILAQNILNTPNLYDNENPWIPYLNNTLKAKNFYIKDTHYLVKNNQIIIIDEFTGRVMEDRRWGEGLHQAVEAKEKISVKSPSETLGSITYQNFFLSYPKFSGMTGTAKTEELEFEEIYGSSVIVIPTAKKMIRNDLPDSIFQNSYNKFKALAKFTAEINKVGRPILIGTTSIEKSEIISTLLTDLNIKHRLLNAKPENVKLESGIIAQAGKKYAVTVSTNMAGRGTDILLGGNFDFQTRQHILFLINNLQNQRIFLIPFTKIEFLLKNSKFKKFSKILFLKIFELSIIYRKFFRSLLSKNIFDPLLNKINKKKNIFDFYSEIELEDLLVNLKENNYINKKSLIQYYFNLIYEYFFIKNKLKADEAKAFVKNIGGLYVIGTERHESRRIDNQLRGRAGRQGDPGTSQFFVSLDDDIFRIFGDNKFKIELANSNSSDSRSLESKIFTNLIENCQKKVESFNYEARKRLFDYDEVINLQRRTVYRERKALLKYISVRPEILSYGEDLIITLVKELKALIVAKKKDDFNLLNAEISYLLNLNYLLFDFNDCKLLKFNQSTLLLFEQFWLTYDLKEAEFNSHYPQILRLIEKISILKQIDLGWKLHLQKNDLLLETISWRAYAQLDPLQEYKTEGFNLFIETIREIKYNCVCELLKAQLTL